MRIVVTGGAGYIGSHTVVQLLEAGHDVVVIDNFANSKPSVLDRIEQVAGTRPTLVAGDVQDQAVLDGALLGGADAVIHFAGLKSIGESVQHPLRYYGTNIDTTLALLTSMARHDVQTIVFSSSATVYGPDGKPPLTEDSPTSATNPYGWTKVMIEQILRDACVADDRLKVAALRYFNPVGAHPSGLIGEDPTGVPANLAPYLAQVAVGRRDEVLIFGDDYPTPDGTGIRDYIHVLDLADGHLAALEHVAAPEFSGFGTWNLGTGHGVSVLELVAAFSRAVGRDLPTRVTDRRPGDLVASYCDPSKANADLGWKAHRSLEEACADAWRWQQRNPEGYPG